MAKPKTVYTLESLLARTVEEGDCRLWTGSMGTTGTPQVYVGGKMVAVRRHMAELAGKEIRDGHYFAPSCGNQACVDPAHTVQRNGTTHYKAMAKQAHGPASAVRLTAITVWRRANPIKLDMERARAIRQDDRPYPEVAAAFGISRSMVGRIKRDQLWRDTANPFAGLMATGA